MSKSKKILFGYLTIFTFILIFTLAKPTKVPSIKIIDYSFSEVTGYLAEKFKIDVTSCIKEHPEVWGPDFLDKGTLYWIETEEYIPNKKLKFEARYYQIGGEESIFTIKSLGENQTEISIDRTIRFFIKMPNFGRSEKRILNIIEKDLKNSKE